jgi:formamidopyrimidine-DNA glycosylase
MPELPEVETIARSLRPSLIGRRIVRADVRWPRTIATSPPRRFERDIQDQVILDVSRRAKFLHFRLSRSHLFIHLRMSGDLVIKPGRPRAEKHDRLVLELAATPQALSSGRREYSMTGKTCLIFNDTRKFGRVWLTNEAEVVTGRLGPEPLGPAFTAKWLHTSLHARQRHLKPLLLDQTFVAGLGNIYTDEALHMARLHPLKRSHTVSHPQAQRLHAAIRRVLAEGIRRNGASIDWVYRGGDFQNHFRVYDREGEPCPVCGTSIKRVVVGQRGTHLCPRCQRI